METTSTPVTNRGPFWIKLSLINLAIVALFGFILRSKILFSIPWLDYQNILNAHSHFAFAGWVGLVICTLLIYNLPADLSRRRVYQYILGGIQLSAVGMALTFPILGYKSWSIVFSTLYIVVNYWFAFVYIRDVRRTGTHKVVKLLSVSSIISLLLSAAGPFTLVYIITTKSGNSLLYRDAVYTFLHFQYNGFFTLAVFALLFQFVIRKGVPITNSMSRFSSALALSVLPSVFLSLVWHKEHWIHLVAAVGCIFLVIALIYFIRFFSTLQHDKLFTIPIAKHLCLLALLSFALKLLLNAGTIIPELAKEVFGDRPVIIGFLHLVFLGFVSFFILSMLVEKGFFSGGKKVMKLPLIVFAIGIIANEVVLMVQGLGILFKTNSSIYSWLLWVVSIILFVGAAMTAITTYRRTSPTQL